MNAIDTTAVRKWTPYLLFVVLVTTCGARPITLVPAGQQSVGDLKIDVGPGWNTLNAEAKGGAPVAIWTCDGPLLDRFVVYAGVGDDRPLLNERSKLQLPHFRSAMPQSDIVTLVETNLASMFGDEPAAIVSRNVRAQDFGGNAGFVFEVDVTPVELATYKGTIGAFVAGQKLYLLMYIGVDPHYYDKHLAEAQQMIGSARL